MRASIEYRPETAEGRLLLLVLSDKQSLREFRDLVLRMATSSKLDVRLSDQADVRFNGPVADVLLTIERSSIIKSVEARHDTAGLISFTWKNSPERWEDIVLLLDGLLGAPSSQQSQFQYLADDARDDAAVKVCFNANASSR